MTARSGKSFVVKSGQCKFCAKPHTGALFFEVVHVFHADVQGGSEASQGQLKSFWRKSDEEGGRVPLPRGPGEARETRHGSPRRSSGPGRDCQKEEGEEDGQEEKAPEGEGEGEGEDK